MAQARALHNAPNPDSVFRPISTDPSCFLVSTYLSDTHRAPLILPQQFQSALGCVVVFFRDRLEHSLGKLHVSVFVFVV